MSSLDNPSAGGVSGPASSTDDGIATYDGTDGGTLQSTGVTIDDSDVVTFAAGSSSSASVTFAGATNMGIGTRDVGGGALAMNFIADSGTGIVVEFNSATGTRGSWIEGSGNYQTQNGGSMLNETPSSTNPTVVPERDDPDTGLGVNGGNVLALIAGGTDVAEVKTTALEMQLPVALKSYTVAGVPAATAGHLIYVSDETGGATVAFADGTNWRRVQDRAIVS